MEIDNEMITVNLVCYDNAMYTDDTNLHALWGGASICLFPDNIYCPMVQGALCKLKHDKTLWKLNESKYDENQDVYVISYDIYNVHRANEVVGNSGVTVDSPLEIDIGEGGKVGAKSELLIDNKSKT